MRSVPIQWDHWRSFIAVAEEGSARGIRTRRGGTWQVSNVKTLLERIAVLEDS